MADDLTEYPAFAGDPRTMFGSQTCASVCAYWGGYKPLTKKKRKRLRQRKAKLLKAYKKVEKVQSWCAKHKVRLQIETYE